MKQMILKVLHQCDTLQAKSVAFPAIATGQLGFPTEVVAQIMLQTIKLHLQQSTTSIQRVELMIYDDATCEKFQDVLDSVSKLPLHAKSAPGSVQIADSPPGSQALMKRRYSQTTLTSDRSMLKETYLDELCMQFVKGDITEDSSDYLVNIVSQSPRLLDTGLQGTFLKKGGQELQLAYMAATREKGNPTKTRIIETAGPVGGLKCKLVGHICPPDGHRELKRTIKSVLEQAEKAHSQSVVFPLVLKTGKKEFAVDKVAKYYYKGVASFIKNPHGTLTKVIFMHPEEQLSHQFFLAFDKAMKERAPSLAMRPLQAIKKLTTSKLHSSDDAATFKWPNPARRSLSSSLALNFEEDGPAVWITAYASTETVAKMVTKKVQQFVNTEFTVVIIDDPNVNQLQLQPHTCERLAKEAEKKHVKLTFKGPKVVLQGHKHGTEQIKNSVHKELSQIRSAKDRFDLEVAEQQKNQAELHTQQVEAAKEQVESQKQEAERGRLQAEVETAKKSQELEQIKTHGK